MSCPSMDISSEGCFKSFMSHHTCSCYQQRTFTWLPLTDWTLGNTHWWILGPGIQGQFQGKNIPGLHWPCCFFLHHWPCKNHSSTIWTMDRVDGDTTNGSAHRQGKRFVSNSVCGHIKKTFLETCLHKTVYFLGPQGIGGIQPGDTLGIIHSKRCFAWPALWDLHQATTS